MSLGSKIQSLRQAVGLSQKDLANLVGVTTGAVAEWEADETMPDLAALSALSKALSVSSDVLLDAATGNASQPTNTFVVKTPTPAVRLVRKKRLWWLAISIVVVLIAAICVVAFLVGKGSTGSNNINGTNSTTETSKPLTFSEDTAAIEAADASVVTVFCYDYEGELAATGSGFIAFDGKTVITNYHVMTSAYTCKISTNQDITYVASKILCYSKEQDIAILQLQKDTGLTPLTLGDSTTVKKGEAVVAIGSPLGIKNTVSTGVLSGRIMDGNMDILQFTAPISSGSSGGALFDDLGNVIGITYASFKNGQNLNLAIPIEIAIELYNSKGAAQAISAIYVEEHPYVEYLSEYTNVIDVSLEELKRNPEKYNGKTVRIRTYISSEGPKREYWDFRSYYIADQEKISLDFEQDEWYRCVSGYSFQQMPVAYCSTLQAKFVDARIEPGYEVVVIAVFEFLPKGTPAVPDDPDCPILIKQDTGMLYVGLIYLPD